MARKGAPAKGEFIPTNPNKYFGKTPIVYRSSWEISVMVYFDQNEGVLGWSSESVQIPYYNPFTKRMTVYIPDFLVVYVDKNNKKHVEIVEVKPMKETEDYTGKSSPKDRMSQALNACKWRAARAYCAKHKMFFRVLTEYDIYSANRRKKK